VSTEPQRWRIVCIVECECDKSIKENILFRKSITGLQLDKDVFKYLLIKQKMKKLNKYLSICSDSAKATRGKIMAY